MALAGIFLTAVFAHRKSLSYWFTSADTIPLIASARVESAADLGVAFTEPLMAETRFEEVGLFYRPLSTLSFALDYALWGLDPAGYHLTNLLLHGITAVLAAIALAAVTRRRGTGYLGGLLFAIHPLTAEVVPAAGRRQDVLMTLFLLGALVLLVRSFRRAEEGSGSCRALLAGRSAFAGSVGLYGLALLAKEPALVFPGIVVAWVALEHGRDGEPAEAALRDAITPGAIRAAIVAVVPYVVVTWIYFTVRSSVLDGMGGYQNEDAVELDERVLAGVEYLLSLGYPQDPVGFATLSGTEAAWWLVVLAMSAAAGVVVVGMVFGCRTGSTGVGDEPEQRPRASPLRALGALAFCILILAIPLTIRFEAVVYRRMPWLYADGSTAFAYPRPGSAVLGLLLIAACVAAVAWALRVGSWVGSRPLRASDRVGSHPLRASDRIALLFLLVWLAGPLALFAVLGDYALRSGYVSVVPATGVLALVLTLGIERLRGKPGQTLSGSSVTLQGSGLVLVGTALLLLVPLVATSPLAHDYAGWEASGEINEAALIGVEDATENAPPGADLRVEGLVINVADRGCEFPRAKSVLYARPGTVEAWLDLHDHEHDLTTADARLLRERPGGVTAHTGVEADDTDRAIVRMEYSESNSGACATEAWDRVS